MPLPTENKSSSSGSERLTIAYAESAVESEHGGEGQEVSEDSSFSYSSSSSSSLETPTSMESVSSQLAALDRTREMQSHFGYEPVWRTMSTSGGPKLRALDYLWAHSVFQLFSFLMSHLLAHTPADPVPFLMSLVDRCIRYRDLDDEPPLLFQDSHVSSVYGALDPAGDGCITYSQYLAGMNTLGLTDFNLMPNEDEFDNRNIAKDVFLAEVKVALLNQLDSLLGKESTKSTLNTDRHTSVSNDNVEKSTGQPIEDKGLVTASKERGGSNKTYIVS